VKRLQVMELFKEHHPNLTNVQFNLCLENSANEIISATGISKTTYRISSVAGQRWYDLEDGTEKVEKVYFNDVLIPRLIGEPIIDDDEFTGTNYVDSYDSELTAPISNANNKRFWMLSQWDSVGDYRTPRLGIVEKSTNTVTRDGRVSDYQSCSITGNSNIRVFLTKAAVSSSVGTDSDSGVSSVAGPLAVVPAHYHEVLLNGAISLGYKNPRNLNVDLSVFYDNEFRKGIKRIKKYERTKSSTGFIKPQDF
tara:strand:- start:643 stop:1398 length:756 start_codon:yes stop_codon:yes gene_type:complete